MVRPFPFDPSSLPLPAVGEKGWRTWKLATTMVLTAALVLSTFATLTGPPGGGAAATCNDPDTPLTVWPIDGVPTSFNDNAVVKWDDELLQTIRANPAGTGPTSPPGPSPCSTPPSTTPGRPDPVADGVWYTGKATGLDPREQAEGDQLRRRRDAQLAVPRPAALVSDGSGLGEFDAQMLGAGYTT